MSSEDDSLTNILDSLRSLHYPPQRLDQMRPLGGIAKHYHDISTPLTNEEGHLTWQEDPATSSIEQLIVDAMTSDSSSFDEPEKLHKPKISHVTINSMDSNPGSRIMTLSHSPIEAKQLVSPRSTRLYSCRHSSSFELGDVEKKLFKLIAQLGSALDIELIWERSNVHILEKTFWFELLELFLPIQISRQLPTSESTPITDNLLREDDLSEDNLRENAFQAPRKASSDTESFLDLIPYRSSDDRACDYQPTEMAEGNSIEEDKPISSHFNPFDSLSTSYDEEDSDHYYTQAKVGCNYSHESRRSELLNLALQTARSSESEYRELMDLKSSIATRRARARLQLMRPNVT